MSFLSVLEKNFPKAIKPLRFLVLGDNPNRRVERASISVVILLVVATALVFAGSGVQIFASGFGNSISVQSASFSIIAIPDAVAPGYLLFLVASVYHFIPNTLIGVTITVTGPHGIDGSKTVTIRTNSEGDGSVVVVYPFASPFTGTSSTGYTGEYHVTGIFAFVYSIHTATTTFQVIQPYHHH